MLVGVDLSLEWQDMDGVTPSYCAENLFAPVVLNELKDVAQMGYVFGSKSFLLFT